GGHHHHHHGSENLYFQGACPSQCSCSGTTVDCSGKSLASVPGGIPTTTQVLYLYDNQITKLEPGVFDRLVNLQQLWLEINQLTSLPAGVFDNLTQLSILNMHTNQLKSIPRGAFDNLKSLTHIWLLNNPWDCACSDILYLSGWLGQHAGKEQGQAVCSGTNTPVRAVTEASTSPSKCP
uniref:Variable Lymphocyte Receptor 9 (VLR9) n=1 Tax=Petromyzon marinus TaxID=7757 RepID=UPI000D53C344|nr:Chain C, Variable Lymphocyte Receptor 9 (VLR9) [Petromyzon marinus]6BXC_D Chain D, Variable Lymphocyte Receptor 9 (VLR9) [Petromyzon marinus]6BXE_A Chain A, Variable lymphocyte receptor diversity region [Petromyzon marinus]6BXE_B Chain B, Variable lymphocyte receptor diversity region [Petromyzon marinus]